MHPPTFDWVPFFEELADKLVAYEDRQAELVAFLREAQISVAEDQHEAGPIPLSVMDPFTFFAHITKHSQANQITFLSHLKGRMGIEAPVPTSFEGVPSSNAQRLWYFPYQSLRGDWEIPCLWALFHQTLAGAIQEDTFVQALGIIHVAAAKLSTGLFYVRPKEHFPFNRQVQTLLKEKGIPGTFKTLGEYQQALQFIRETFDAPFYQLSYEGWRLGQVTWDIEAPQPEPKPETEAELDPETEQTMPISAPLNLILYGPPGTGKTYQTMNRAVKIIDGEAPADRHALKRRYRELVQEKRIAFATFHQSFGYEEFVEGIRAETQEGQINYDVQPGIFLQISRAALLALGELLVTHFPASEPSQTVDYDELYDSFLQSVEKSLGKEGYRMPTSAGKQMEVVDISAQGNLNLRHEGFTRTYTTSRNRLKKLWQSFDTVSAIKHVQNDIRETIGGANFTAYWAAFNALKEFEKSFEPEADAVEGEIGLNEAEAAQKDYSELSPAQLAQADRYVLIIDEINRGNIAKILGELITLLEPSKRLGAPDEQRVILPYSKVSFGVPPNLYLIGTMNTADRSIARLDTALRRRFHFEEVMPDPALLAQQDVEGVDLAQLLHTLNQRIEYLFDRDHTLGHAYFMGIDTVAGLNQVFRDKVIPLLQEYFYGDWEKICLVLGDHDAWGKPRAQRLLQAEALEGEGLFGETPDYQAPPHYQVNPLLHMGQLPAAAFVAIYQRPAAS